MPADPPFPSAAYGWGFLFALGAALAAAAVVDARTRRIPKLLSVGLAPVGLLANGVWGAWLGLRGAPFWFFRTPGGFAGLFDGLLFGVAGLLLAFVLMFVLWNLGTCGGGDVKLFASIGAWTGPGLVPWTLGATVLVVAALVVFRLVRRALQGAAASASTARDRLVTFSFPLLVGTMAVMLWARRGQLWTAGEASS